VIGWLTDWFVVPSARKPSEEVRIVLGENEVNEVLTEYARWKLSLRSGTYVVTTRYGTKGNIEITFKPEEHQC
jgi:hypothetical protein